MEKDLLQKSSSPRIVIQPKKTYRQDSNGISDTVDTLAYTHTLMYGRYATDLGEYAKDEAKKLKMMAKRQKAEDKRRKKELQLEEDHGSVYRACAWVWHNTLARFGDEWIFLATMGIIMALISFTMDVAVHIVTTARVWLYRDIFNSSLLLQFWAWVLPILCLVLFAAGFTHLVAPQAAGSGIPEMKTILRGVVLKEYLTFKTMVAKVVGLTAALAGGVPIGKEGPFVHIASIVATMLSKLRFHKIYENKSRYTDMLAAACATGIGACFAAPIGGVLFSIEATTTYFAVRNCWRGFFSAVCGSSVLLLLVVWFQNVDTVRALFMTNFTSEYPFAPQELFVYALMGVVGGFLGAGYVWLHRYYVTFIRTNKTINDFLQKNRFIYPTIIAFVVATISFPLGTGQYFGGELSTQDQLTQLFSNFTWSRDDLSVDQKAIVSNWKTPNTSIFLNLACYFLYNYIFSIVCYTLPVPSGSFIPVFKIGAGLGRIFGELMHILFPLGVWYGGILSPIIPGSYAVVGAAAFSSAVTHTVSEAVIIFEITGQVTHVVPVMIASLIANAVAEMLQPSMYDSMILIKKLPYLPDLLPSSSKMYTTFVDSFMRRDVKYIWTGITYQELRQILRRHQDIRNLPLVDSPDNMILLGSVQRTQLVKMVEGQIGREKRMVIAYQWHEEAEQRAQEEQLEVEAQQKQIERRRSSRFEVFPAPDILKPNEEGTDRRLSETLYEQSPTPTLSKENEIDYTPMVVTYPEKDYSLRSALENLKISPNINDVERGSPDSSRQNTKRVTLRRDYIVDMSPEDKKQWEREELSKPVDFQEHNIVIDPSPFQLVERTAIIKVHTLFNMVGINHAYVTKIGRLVGIVGLDELRKAIEDINSNTLILSAITKDDEAKPLIYSHKDVNNTITSMDSAFSAGCSENGSEADVDAKKLQKSA